jgi:hypothetical protein
MCDRNTNCCFANPINRYNFGGDRDLEKNPDYKKKRPTNLPTEIPGQG